MGGPPFASAQLEVLNPVIGIREHDHRQGLALPSEPGQDLQCPLRLGLAPGRAPQWALGHKADDGLYFVS
jgi:hypothetical protein